MGRPGVIMGGEWKRDFFVLPPQGHPHYPKKATIQRGNWGERRRRRRRVAADNGSFFFWVIPLCIMMAQVIFGSGSSALTPSSSPPKKPPFSPAPPGVRSAHSHRWAKNIYLCMIHHHSKPSISSIFQRHLFPHK